ncbi:MAG: nitrous oxide reductase family maturation protein NosD [Bdellovibrionota bacterium]
MNPKPPSAEERGRAEPDTIASLTLAAVAGLALLGAWVLPWWTLQAQAPQYGPRVLIIDVSPVGVAGDVKELDTLGHYVGIRPMGSLARFERLLAPVGLAAATAGLLAAAWIRRRSLRVLVLLPAVLLPVFFLADLDFWLTWSVKNLDPTAAVTINIVEPQVFGRYEVGQFKMNAKASEGLYLAVVAGLLGLGLAFSAPLAPPRWRRKKKALAVAATATLAFASALSSARAADYRATPEGHVQDLISRAAAGDTIILSPGVYREHLVIPVSLRLRGEPGAVLDGENRGTIIRVTAPGVEIQGLTIRSSGSNYTAEDAGIRLEAPGTRILESRIEDTLFGVFAVQATGCAIENSTIVGKDVPIFERGDAIRLWYSSGCKLLGNHIERSRDVIIWYSSDVIVRDNTVRHGRYGLHYMFSNNNVFHGNRFEDNEVAAAIMYSRGIELEGNDFSFSTGPSAHGLLVKDSDDVFIIRNRFIGNSTGLFFDGAPQSRGGKADVRGNLVARNQTGVALQPLSRGARFWENAFVGNQVPVQIQGTGSGQNNEWSVGGRGNYWSEAATYDPDGDGVSNLPYRVESTFEELSSRHAVLSFFSLTPAAGAIDTAAKWFPIYAPRPRMEDAHPLLAPPAEALEKNPTGPGAALALTGTILMGLAGGLLRGAKRVLA